MLLSENERGANKKAHLARIAAKGSPDYLKLYDQQPAQRRRVDAMEVKLLQVREAQDLIASLNISDAEGAAQVFGGGNLASATRKRSKA